MGQVCQLFHLARHQCRFFFIHFHHQNCLNLFNIIMFQITQDKNMNINRSFIGSLIDKLNKVFVFSSLQVWILVSLICCGKFQKKPAKTKLRVSCVHGTVGKKPLSTERQAGEYLTEYEGEVNSFII